MRVLDKLQLSDSVALHHNNGSCVNVQADLLYLPFMERFALALPTLTSSNLVDACNGVMLPWLEAMGKLECCQQACPDHKLFQQALRCLPLSSSRHDSHNTELSSAKCHGKQLSCASLVRLSMTGTYGCMCNLPKE